MAWTDHMEWPTAMTFLSVVVPLVGPFVVASGSAAYLWAYQPENAPGSLSTPSVRAAARMDVAFSATLFVVEMAFLVFLSGVGG